MGAERGQAGQGSPSRALGAGIGVSVWDKPSSATTVWAGRGGCWRRQKQRVPGRRSGCTNGCVLVSSYSWQCPMGGCPATGTPLLLLTCLAAWLISTARSEPEFPIPITMTLLSVKSRASL